MSNQNLDEAKRPLVLRIFDVGHGESILLQFPDNQTLGVVDCHTHPESNRIAEKTSSSKLEPKVLSFLRKLKKANPRSRFTMAFICLSHFHDDHYSGLARLIAGLRELEIPLKEYWDPGVSPKKVAALATIATPESKLQVQQLEVLYKELNAEFPNLKVHHLTTQNLNFRAYGEVCVDVLAPHYLHWHQYLKCLSRANINGANKRQIPAADENAISSILLLKYANATALLTGDAPNGSWDILFDPNTGFNIPRVDLLKLSHHGSRQGNFTSHGRRSILKQLSKPGKTIAVVSGGYRQALPHSETTGAVHKNGAKLYCTGDFRQGMKGDPVEDCKLPKTVIDVIKEDSKPILEAAAPLHGDISVFLFPDGTVKVETEFSS